MPRKRDIGTEILDGLRELKEGRHGRVVEAQPVLDESVGASLRKARLAAGLTQLELAQKLEVDQSMVNQVENGKSRVAEAYVRRVLEACELPADWVG
ncbi:MAG TPA: helix-turn-helix transcriptional regulator [Polyangiaceae bacterium]|nr:helix-turn-helix transcriptional regulator [Polyangiaceae bacterium]